MNKKLFAAFWLISMLAVADPVSPGKLREIKAELDSLNSFRNWASSLNLLGIDIRAGAYWNDELRLMEERKAAKVEFAVVDVAETKVEAFQLKKAKEITIEQINNNLYLFRAFSGIHAFGLHTYSDANGKFFRDTVYRNISNEKCHSTAPPKDLDCVLDADGKLCAFQWSNPLTVLILEPDLKISRTVKLQEPLFARRAWPLKNGDYLIFHFPYGAGTLFSIVDGAGRVKSRFYDATCKEGISPREYFFIHFCMADFHDGKAFLTRVFPETDVLEVEEIDCEKKTIRRMKCVIDDFHGPRQDFKKRLAYSLGKAGLAAVNGIFPTQDYVIVSISLGKEHRGREQRTHYLYVFDRNGIFRGHIKVPFGAVLYHDREGKIFVSQKDSPNEVADQTEFVLFTLK